MASKAAAALLRIREIDKKYKSKHIERYPLFSDSSKSIDTEKPQKLLKPQLNIKMPDPYEEYVNENTSSESKECSVPIKIIDELPKQSSNSNVNSATNNNSEEHKTTSDKIITNNEHTSRDETNESISELLEDTKSITQISIESQKSTDENSSSNILTRNETSTSDKQIRTEEDDEEEVAEEEQEETNEKENVDLEKKSSLVHYSDESFESSSSESDDSQLIAASEQLQSKINHKKVSITGTISSNNEDHTSDDIVSNCLNVSHDKLQKSDETLSTTNKNSNSSNFSNDSTSDTKLSSGSRNRNKQISTKDDGNQMVKTIEKTSYESEITSKYSNKQHIKSSESTSQVLEVFDRKSNKKMFKEYNNTIEAIKSSRHISSSSLTSSRSSQIIKPKSPKKVDTHHKKKYVYDKPNEKYCSSAMINYVRKIREEQQQLNILPTQMICLDKIKIQSIKPLEFPKILNFVQNNEYKNPDFNMEILQNHLSNIRQWLKDQYLIYRENCEVAVHINSNYHPITLNETKKIIYQLQSEARAKNKNQ